MADVQARSTADVQAHSTADVQTGSYPILLGLTRPISSSRLWAIPVFGLFVKAIILTPHSIVLNALGFATLVAHLVIWIPVLFTGRYPDWAWVLTAGTLRWSTRVSQYLLGLTDTYPAFSMHAPGDIQIERPESSSRFFAVPVIGSFVKGIILIPHVIVLYVLGFVVMICELVIWIPVLFTGQFPGWAFQLVSGYVLWSSRVGAYLLGLTDSYPPFSFS
jgi:hypothetical protein